MAKIIRSLNMEERVWKRIDKQADMMKRSTSSFCEQHFAEQFGMMDLVPVPPKPKDKP